MNHSLPGSYIHGTLQARILEWVAVPFSRGSSQPRDYTHGGTRRVGGLLGVAGRLSGTVSPFRAEQGTSLEQSPGREAALAWASLAQRFPASSVLAREGAGCGSVPSPGDLPDPGTEPGSPALQADAFTV